jgi:hypothetical protein
MKTISAANNKKPLRERKGLIAVIICAIVLVATLAIAAVLTNGFGLLSPDVPLEANADADADTDADNVPDSIEEDVGSDINKADTDGDGLDDFQEIVVLASNPLKVDSDENGTSDYDEDFDADTLGNGIEFSVGTNPLNSDSDFDELSDSEELVHSTNQLNEDTDSDGAGDGWEVQNAYDPLKKNESFEVSKAGQSSYVTANVTTQLAGENIDSLSVEPTRMMETIFISDIPGYIDTAFDLRASEDIEAATISMEFEEALLKGESFTPVICYYDEDAQFLEPLPTKVTENVATAEITHFSKYILLDLSAALLGLGKVADTASAFMSMATPEDMNKIMEFIMTIGAEEITNSDTTDTNNDGINDHCLQLLLNGSLRTGTWQAVLEETDLNGGNFDYLNTDSDWDDDGIKNGDELKITTRDVGGKKYAYAKLVSNPLLADSDSDSFNDYDEINTFKTDPMKYNELYIKEYADEVFLASQYHSYEYYKKYEGQDSHDLNFFKSTRFYDETSMIGYAGKFDLVDLSKGELREYLQRIVSENKDYVEFQQWSGLLNEILAWCELGANAGSAGIDDLDLELLRKDITRLQHQVGQFDYEKLNEEAARAYKTLQENPRVKAFLQKGRGAWKLNNLSKVADVAGYALDVIDGVNQTLEELSEINAIEANLSLYQQEIDLLNLIVEQSDDSNVRAAARDLREDLQSEYNIQMSKVKAKYR